MLGVFRARAHRPRGTGGQGLGCGHNHAATQAAIHCGVRWCGPRGLSTGSDGAARRAPSRGLLARARLDTGSGAGKRNGSRPSAARGARASPRCGLGPSHHWRDPPSADGRRSTPGCRTWGDLCFNDRRRSRSDVAPDPRWSPARGGSSRVANRRKDRGRYGPARASACPHSRTAALRAPPCPTGAHGTRSSDTWSVSLVRRRSEVLTLVSSLGVAIRSLR
jgi:hypothetical protein